MPEVDEEIVVIWQSDAIIPNTNVSFHPVLEEDVHEALTEAFLEVSSTDTGLDLLTNATAYEIQALKVIDDSVYDPLRTIVRQTQTDLNTTIGK
jgi:ABC-type phosphate/phosphonate transport system substrate-binding protein